jgi:hypothetical protein
MGMSFVRVEMHRQRAAIKLECAPHAALERIPCSVEPLLALAVPVALGIDHGLKARERLTQIREGSLPSRSPLGRWWI